MFEQMFTLSTLPTTTPPTENGLYAPASTAAPTTNSQYYLEYNPYPSHHQGDFRPTFYNPFEIKHRRRTSRAQLKVLEKSFSENPKPNATVRRLLAQKLDMTPRGVQIWFQNRRAKAKLQRRKSCPNPTTISNAISVPEEQPPMPPSLQPDLKQTCLTPEHPSNAVLFSQFLANSACDMDHKPDYDHYFGTAKLEHQPWSENARAVAEAAAATCYLDFQQQQQQKSVSPLMMEDWMAMPIHPLAPVIQSENDAHFLSTLSADDWRRKSCPALSYPDFAQQPSPALFHDPQFKERRVSDPTLQYTWSSLDHQAPTDFYYPIDYCSPQDQQAQQQLTPLLSTGSVSPISLDMDPSAFSTTDALLHGTALV